MRKKTPPKTRSKKPLVIIFIVGLLSLIALYTSCLAPAQPALNEHTETKSIETQKPEDISAQKIDKTSLPISEPTAQVPKAYGRINVKFAQLGVTPQWIDHPEIKGSKILVQKSADKHLLLSPNECYFLGKLHAGGKGVAGLQEASTLHNGGKNFSEIIRWDKGKVARWHVLYPQAGEVKVNVHGSGKGNFSVQMNGQTQQVNNLDGKTQLSFTIKKSGVHTVSLHCIKADKKKTKINFIEVYGANMHNAGVLRSRWRPAAAHARFSSSATKENCKLWVIELDSVPCDFTVYSPVTTPFGYFGSTFTTDGYPTGMNFSMWSFSAKSQEPQTHMLSHLIAVGHKDASFGGFSHEGTGVKVRNWNPYAQLKSKRQVLAIRVEPGKPYDTYYGYYYDFDTANWRFFAAGRKFNKGRPLKRLSLGNFVEVPGPPHRERTGDTVRAMRYRGWICNQQNQWFALDQLSSERQTGYANRQRQLSDDGRLMMQMGGMVHVPAEKNKALKVIEKKQLELPEYLKGSALATLQKMPSSLHIDSVKRKDGKVFIKYRINNLQAGAKLKVFWGESNGLTLERKWGKSKNLLHTVKAQGEFSFSAESQSKSMRLQLRQANGQFWSMESHIIP